MALRRVEAGGQHVPERTTICPDSNTFGSNMVCRAIH